ncbi:MAG: histidinol-phosphate aminotransferase family protein [Acidobacteria bacterium]|nr:histidinol-phosphate aminotransferase family protein [Acidobacteriota bacterium]
MAFSRRGFLRTLTAGTVAGSLSTWSGKALAGVSAITARPERDAEGFLLLDSNENVYGPSAKVVSAVQESLSRANRYPFREYDALTQDIARSHKVDSNQIVLGCGSTDILRVCAAALLGPGKRVITASPTFEDLAMYSRAIGAEVVTVPLTPTFAHDLDAMLARIDDTVTLVYLCNPNNPTASITPRVDIEGFLSKLPPSVCVLVDEAYHHYVNASARYVSFLDRPVNNERMIVMRTFSKIHGIAGLRLGYAVMDHRLAEKMRTYLTDVDVNCTAVAAGRASLADTESVQLFAKRNRDDRQEFFNQAMARMLKPIDSHTNFVMMDAHQPADDVIAHFLKDKIRIGRHFPPLTHHIRISLGTPSAMNEFWRVWDLLPQSKMSM